MGYYNTSTEAETIYTAYGYTVKGKTAVYEWTFSGEKGNCYTYLSIEDAEGNIIFSYEFGNNYIIERTFTRHIDNVLWYLSHEKVSSYEMEKIIQKALVENSCLFSGRIENMKRKEKADAEIKALQESIQKVEAEKKQIIQELCNKKDLVYVELYGYMYIFKVLQNVEKITAILQTANTKNINHFVNFAEDGRQKELRLIYSGYSTEEAQKEVEEV